MTQMHADRIREEEPVRCTIVVHCGGCGRMIAAWDAQRTPIDVLGNVVRTAAAMKCEISFQRGRVELSGGCVCNAKIDTTKLNPEP